VEALFANFLWRYFVRIKLAVFVFVISTISTVYGQQLDPALQSATIIGSESLVTPNIVYKRANGFDIKLDVITAGPRSQTRPTLIYIHGGGWIHGSKEQYSLWSLPFLARGMNVVNVEYRMAGDALAPAAVEDCRCALRWVYKRAKDYGFDTTKLVVAGHSAGGHLSLMTGMLDASAGFDNEGPGKEELKVAASVNFYGITDVAEVLDGPKRQDWAVMWLGALPDRMELARRLSPLTYIRSGLPPIISLHGDGDPVVPSEQAVRLHQALDHVGVPNQLVMFRAHQHGAWTREQNLAAEAAVFEFLEKHNVLAH
jgi:acetyl esterase/lipase